MNKFDYLVFEATYLMNEVMKCMAEDLRNDWKTRKEYLKSKKSMEYVEDVYLYFMELCELNREDLSDFYSDFRKLRCNFMNAYDESLPDLIEYSHTLKNNK